LSRLIIDTATMITPVIKDGSFSREKMLLSGN